MEAGELREPREPGPGAETAAARCWEETKTFYENLAPKKKPKSVTAGPGYGGRAGEGTPREGRKPSGEGPVAGLQERTQLLRTRMCRALGTGSRLFWELCAGVFFPPGSGSTPGTPLPHAVLRAQFLREPAARGARTALVGTAGQRRLPKAPRARVT